DVAEAALRQVGLQRGKRVRRFHIGHETHVDLGDSAMRQNRFAAWTGVAADESFDVYGRLRFESFVRLLPRQIIDPMLYAELLFRQRFAARLRYFFDHRFLFSGQRKRLRIVVDHDYVTVLGHEWVERFDQMPRWTVHHRLERRVNVLRRTASPLFAARDKLEFDNAFRAQVHRNDPVEVLRRKRHEYADTLLERRKHLGTPNELRDVRRTDLLFAFGHQHQVYRHLLSRTANRVQSSEERRFRSLLVHRATSNHDFSKWRFVHNPRFGRRRRPLRRIELFHIVHEIEPDRFRRTGVERREHAGLAVCVNYHRLLKSRIAREFRHVLRTLRISTVLRRDRNLRNPILQPLHRLVVPLRDFRFDLGAFSVR